MITTGLNKVKFYFVFCVFACLPVTCFGVPNVILSNQVAMDFGLIEYSGSGSVMIGTNGNVTYTGGFSGDGLGTAGAVLATFTNSTTGTIACSASANITNATGDAVTVTNVEAVLGSGNRTSFGAGTPCLGTGTSIGTFTFSGGTNNRTIYLGGQINAPGSLSGDGAYSSANVGGSYITIVVSVI